MSGTSPICPTQCLHDPVGPWSIMDKDTSTQNLIPPIKTSFRKTDVDTETRANTEAVKITSLDDEVFLLVDVSHELHPNTSHAHLHQPFEQASRTSSYSEDFPSVGVSHKLHPKTSHGSLIQQFEQASLPARFQNTLFPAELSDILIGNSRRNGSDLSPLQVDALRSYLNRPDSYRCVPGNPEDPTVIQRNFHLFDRFYFFGLLSDRLEDHEFGPFESFDTTTPLGATCRFFNNSMGQLRPACFIRIYRYQHPTENSDGQKLAWYLATLMHEMLHAFFFLFSYNTHLQPTMVTNSRGCDGLGHTGHGPAFCNALCELHFAASVWGFPVRRDPQLLTSVGPEIWSRMEEAGTLDKETMARIGEWDRNHELQVNITKEQLSSWNIKLIDLMWYFRQEGQARKSDWFLSWEREPRQWCIPKGLRMLLDN